MEAGTVLGGGEVGAVIHPRGFDAVVGGDLEVGTRAVLGGGDEAGGLTVGGEGGVAVGGVEGGAVAEVGDPVAVSRYRGEPRLRRQSSLALWVAKQLWEGGDGELGGEVGVEVGELTAPHIVVGGVVERFVVSADGAELVAKNGEGVGGGGDGANVGLAE